MKKYLAAAPGTDWQLNERAVAANLELPVDANFLSLPPRIAPQAMLRRIEDNLPWRNRRPGEAKRRLAEKIPVEFEF